MVSCRDAVRNQEKTLLPYLFALFYGTDIKREGKDSDFLVNVLFCRDIKELLVF